MNPYRPNNGILPSGVQNSVHCAIVFSLPMLNHLKDAKKMLLIYNSSTAALTFCENKRKCSPKMLQDLVLCKNYKSKLKSYISDR